MFADSGEAEARKAGRNILAQQDRRAKGSGFQVRLRPLRSSEASCTIHCTSSSNCCVRKYVADPRRSTSTRPDAGDHGDAFRHDSSRQPSTTEAPALTIGRPGKQKVKSVRSGDFFLRSLRTLSRILKHFTGYRNRCRAAKPGSFGGPAGDALPGRTALRQVDLLLQEVAERDVLRGQRLRVQRGRGQPRQRIGLQIDRAIGRDDEIAARIAAA